MKQKKKLCKPQSYQTDRQLHRSSRQNMIYSSKVVPVFFIDRKVQMNCRLEIKLVYFIK